MTKSAIPHIVFPLLLACGCLTAAAAIAVAVYVLFFHYFDSLHGILMGIVIFLHPIPFVLMQVLLVKTFYYFEVFGARWSIGYSENRALLEGLVEAGEPFCLYLRNHSFEKGAAIQTLMASADREPLSRTGLIHWPVPKNVFESSVVASLEKHLPVFAIDSPSDSSIGVARRILVRDSHWLREVDRLIERAALIIVNHEALTDGIMKELEAIRKHEAEARTLLFTTETALASLSYLEPELVRRLKWIEIKDGSPIHKRLEAPTMPQEVIEFAAHLAERRCPLHLELPDSVGRTDRDFQTKNQDER